MCEKTHPDGVMVTTRHQTRPRRRTQGRDVEIGVPEALTRQLVDGGRRNVGAVGTKLREAQVVQDDYDDIRCTCTGTSRLTKRDFRLSQR
jgi:hypothetical protein